MKCGCRYVVGNGAEGLSYTDTSNCATHGVAVPRPSAAEIIKLCEEYRDINWCREEVAKYLKELK